MRAVPSQRDAVETSNALRFMRYSSGMDTLGRVAAGVFGGALVACAASIATAADVPGRAWAAGCMNCHQPAGGALPVLQGQPREAIAAKLRAFRDGKQAGTIMPQLAKGYTDAQIDAIAEWLATEKPQ